MSAGSDEAGVQRMDQGRSAQALVTDVHGGTRAPGASSSAAPALPMRRPGRMLHCKA
jgi:hypothetical protein